MKLCVLIPVIVSLTNLASCRNTKPCINCCNDRVMVYGRAEICAQDNWCKQGTWGKDEVLKNISYEYATYVKIFPRSVSNSVTTCSVQNLERLATIYGENAGISAIEVNAFWNLPALRAIHLAFNLLRKIQFGVFSNLPVTVLDLSWNKISSLGEMAFAGMENLRVLNLSHNELVTFDLKPYGNLPLEELIVSHNYLENVGTSFTLNVSSLDFSFNKIKYFTLHDNKVYKKIDLTNNYLSALFWGGGSVEDFRLSLNNLVDAGVLLNKKILIKNITLFPNPWDCAKINVLLKDLQERHVTVVHPNTDMRLNFVYKSYPVCVIPDPDNYDNYGKLRRDFIRHEEKICEDDDQCPGFMICRTGTCWDPCKNNACRNDVKRCETRKHKFSCKCPTGQLARPYQLFAECYFPCFVTSDCPRIENAYRDCDEDLSCRYYYWRRQ